MALKKEIEFIINETFGPKALPIALYLNGKENVSEFVIAKDLSIEIHRVRQMLYKLLEDNIVIFMRKKDKAKGWYICYWSLNEPEFPYIIRKIKQKKLNKFKTRLQQETSNDFYLCPNTCTRMDFDNAFELNFKCPDCGKVMHHQSSERTKEFLKTQIEKLKKDIGDKPIVAKVEEKPIEKLNKHNNKNVIGHSTKLNKSKDLLAPQEPKPKKQTKPKKKVQRKKETRPKALPKLKKKTPTKKVVKSKKKPIQKKVIKPKKKRFSLFRKKK